MLNPKIKKLDNGLTVITDYVPTNMVSVYLTIGIGSRYETLENSGISYLIASMIRKGYLSQSSRELASRIYYSIGGDCYITSNKHEISMRSLVLKENIDEAINYVFNFLTDTKLTEEDFNRAKEEQIISLRECFTNPKNFIYDFYLNLAYPDHPLGFNVLGTEESLKNISKEDLDNYINEMFIPSNMAIAVSGNFNEASLLEEIQRKNQSWGKVDNELSLAKIREQKAKIPLFNSQKKFLLEEQLNYNVAFIHYGLEIANINYKWQDYPKWDVLMFLLNDRFYKALCFEPNNLVYEVNASTLYYDNEKNSFFVDIVCPKDKVQEVQRIIQEEILKASKDLQEEEVQKTKKLLKYHTSISLEDVQRRCIALAADIFTYKKENNDLLQSNIVKSKMEDFKLEEAKAMLEQLTIQDPCVAVISNEEIEI